MSSGENERLAGRYRVVRQLGRGGMGVVWQAVDEVLGREVAVKELRTYTDAGAPELADLRLRMTREARAAARVRHPGVVAVHDVTEHQGRPVIVMELVDGPSLDDVLGTRGTLEPAEAARIGAHVLEALAAAHDVGVLHRDVKPGNILLDSSGRIVLTDFGIATMEDPGDGSATHLTRSGEIVGSLDYLAPERARGQDPGPASDVWALGATLYAAVEGGSPFRRTSTWSTLAAIVTEPLPEPRRAGPLAPVLLRLLDKDPAARPTAREAARLLGAVGETAPDAHAVGAVGAPNSEAPVSEAPGVQTPLAGARDVGVKDAGAQAVEASAPNPYGGSAGPNPYGGSVEANPYGGSVEQIPYGGAAAPSPYGSSVEPNPSAVPDAGPTASPAPAVAPPTGAFGPALPVPPPVHLDAGSAGRAGTRAARRAGTNPRRGNVLVAASVAAVLLAGGGLTYALMERDSGVQASDGTPGDGGRGAAGGDQGRVLDPGTSGVPSPGRSSGTAPPSAGDPSGPGPSNSADGTDRPDPDRTDPASDPDSGGTESRGPGTGTVAGSDGRGGGTTAPRSPGTRTPTTGGSSGGGDTAAPTNGAPPPATGCAPAGSSATCQVVRSATSTRYDGGEMGTVGSGPHVFFCQVDLDRSETYGGRTSRWFARTDDDSGNTNVYLSVLHLSGGAGGGPVEGLRVC
ncbi:protein kinase [Streptomyces sp. NPDC001728]|uniref:protein kinase domain-containing protein n=1 Tax=Streptomyces sp. NPDC001728 TaxID=3154396 RepID=UPI00332A2904